MYEYSYACRDYYLQYHSSCTMLLCPNCELRGDARSTKIACSQPFFLAVSQHLTAAFSQQIVSSFLLTHSCCTCMNKKGWNCTQQRYREHVDVVDDWTRDRARGFGLQCLNKCVRAGYYTVHVACHTWLIALLTLEPVSVL